MSDAFWERVSPLLEPFKRKRSGGRTRSGSKLHLHVDGQGIHKQIYTEAAANGFEEHIRRRQTERRAMAEGERPRRWVVERTFGWLKGFRTLRTRYCHFVQNYIGMMYLAFACILWRKLN